MPDSAVASADVRRPRRRSGHGSGGRRAIFALIAFLGGIGAAVLLGETAMRAYLTWKFRGKLAVNLTNTPGDPARDIYLQEFVYSSPDPDIVYQLKPGVRGLFMRKPLATNSMGLRYREIAREKPAGTLRVLGIGDSYTFGWGVGPDENYLHFLEQALGRLLPDQKVEVINLGCPGYNTVMEVTLLEKLGLPLQPDAVLMQYNIDDATLPLFLARHPYFTRFDRLYLMQLKDLLIGRVDDELNKVAVPQWLEVKKIVQHEAPQISDPSQIPPELAHMIGPDAVRRAYVRLAELCRARGIALFVLVPTESPWEFLPEAAKDPYFDWIRGLCAELRIPTIETFPLDHAFVVGRKFDNSIVFLDPPRDYHPNPIRHSLWAQAALPALARALGGDAVTSAGLQTELDRLRHENEPRTAAWLAAHPASPSAAAARAAGDTATSATKATGL